MSGGSGLLALSFTTPALLGFLGLAAIPIIIYLINRQRYQRVPWAAMEFLLAAMKKNRRRLQVENLLLLLLRVLAIVLLVLAVTRPVLDTGLPVLDASTRAELYLIDRSASMDYRDGSRSLLHQVREQVQQRVKELSTRDRAGLLLGGGYPELPFPEARFVGPGVLAELFETLEGLEVVPEPLEVAITLQAAAEWIERQQAAGEAFTWQVHFYTDLQRRDWLASSSGASAAAPDAPLAADSAGSVSDPGVREALARLETAGASVIVHAVGEPRPSNATISAVQCMFPLLVVDLPTAFEVVVVNHSSETLAGLEVELAVNGEVQGSRQLSLAPGEEKRPSFPTVFRDPGQVRVVARLISDGLEFDNQRQAVYEVRSAVRVLIAEGRPAGAESEGDWLEAALAGYPRGNRAVRLTPYDARTVPLRELNAPLLSEIDVLILANAPHLEASPLIEDFLRSGGGVLAFLGEHVEPGRYAQEGYRDGEGWFPFAPQFHRRDAGRQQVYRWRVDQPEHPVLRYLAATPEAGLTDIVIHGFVPPETPLPPERVLLSLDASVPIPSLVEHDFGGGSVLVLGVAPDRSDSNFPVAPAYVVFLHEALPYLSLRREVPRTLDLHEPFVRVIPAELYAARVFLILPDGSGYGVALVEREDRRSFDLRVNGQARPGIYEVRFGEESSERPGHAEFFAVNADPREGDLTRIAAEELRDLYPSPPLFVLEDGQRPVAGEEPVTPSSGQLWRWLFWVALVVLIGETALARFFGRSRTA